jgi:hypothetical protein
MNTSKRLQRASFLDDSHEVNNRVGAREKFEREGYGISDIDIRNVSRSIDFTLGTGWRAR